MKRHFCKTLLAGIGVLILILDASTALKGARDGVDLCVRVIVPSLFPFFVLVALLNNGLQHLNFSSFSVIERLLKIPRGSGGIWLCGILGGYPTGAQTVYASWKSGAIQKVHADRMLSFCSNAGPAFLFGIIASQFDSKAVAWTIWGIHIMSSVAVARILPHRESPTISHRIQTPLTLTDALRNSVFICSQVCGWVILFRVLSAFLIRWVLWMLPTAIQVMLISLLELANGASMLREIENVGLRMMAAGAAVNCGGLCVLMQTAAVTKGLDLRNYIIGKVLQTGVGTVLTLLAQNLLFSSPFSIRSQLNWLLIPLTVGVLCTYFLFRRENNSSISAKNVV